MTTETRTLVHILENVENRLPIWIGDMETLCEELPERFYRKSEHRNADHNFTETHWFMFEKGQENSFHYEETDNPFQSVFETGDRWSNETIMWCFPES